VKVTQAQGVENQNPLLMNGSGFFVVLRLRRNAAGGGKCGGA
jgi:hypothetical protein